MPNFLKNAIDKSSLGLKSLPKIAPHTFPRWHPKNPIDIEYFEEFLRQKLMLNQSATVFIEYFFRQLWPYF